MNAQVIRPICEAGMNRRRLLIGLAAASSAATVAAATAAAVPALADIPKGSSGQLGQTAEAPAAENPELIRLGDLLPAAEAEFTDAQRSYWEVVEKWEKRWPLAPDAIVKPFRDSSTWERGLRGIAILADGSISTHADAHASDPRSLWGVCDFESFIARIDNDMRRKRIKHPLTSSRIMEMEAERSALADKLALARDYEAAKERVLRASGYPAADARLNAARKALSEVVGAIMAQPELTMAGIVIKAQALSLWGRNPQHILHVPAWEWPHQFAASVLRIASEHQHA